jgi:hypothetical protein
METVICIVRTVTLRERFGRFGAGVASCGVGHARQKADLEWAGPQSVNLAPTLAGQPERAKGERANEDAWELTPVASSDIYVRPEPTPGIMSSG